VTASADRDDPVAALVEATSLLEHYLPDTLIGRVADLSARAGQRLGLGTDLTVVALAGSTGSGKSSLFNALAGLELAEVGVRRPTTSQAMACVWGDVDASPLLDWLGVPSTRRVRHRSVLDDEPDRMHGLVLLDLPDHDSLVQEHRDEVDRLIGLVDVLVWVTDPVKYADALLHEEYLRELTRHDAVVMVLLNQVDRLAEPDQQLCLNDLSRLTEHDGLAEVRVLAVSARTGAGLADLVRPLEAVVASRRAADQRLAADAAALADEVRDGVGGPAPAHEGSRRSVEKLVDASTRALDLDDVVHRIEADQRARAVEALRWPWVKSAGAKAEPTDSGPTVQLDALLGRRVGSATPTSASDVLVDHVAAESAGLPPAWAESVREQLNPKAQVLADAWTRAAADVVAGQPPPPGWWQRHRRGQWLCTALVASSGLAVVALVVALLSGAAPSVWAWVLASVAVIAAGATASALNRRASREPDAWAAEVAARERGRLVALVSDGAADLDARLGVETDRWNQAAGALDRASR